MNKNLTNKQAEYTEAITTYRFFHDYRMKIFNFFLVFNGILLSSVFTYIKDEYGKALISLFAITVCVIMWFFEKRTINAANNILNSVVNLESELNFSTITNLKNYADTHGISQRNLVSLFYFVTTILWLIITLIFIYRLI